MKTDQEKRFINNLPTYIQYLVEYGFDVKNTKLLLEKWSEPHRFFHTLNHLYDLTEQIESMTSLKESEKKILIVSAFFHDIVYNPKRNDNELMSIDFFEKFCPNSSNAGYTQIKEIIFDTINHEPKSKLSKTFCAKDSNILNSDLKYLIEYENAIFKEYQYADYADYKTKRIEFLKNWIMFKSNNIGNINSLIEYIETREPKIGIFPGSFNPMHVGHKNILEKAEKIFDKVIIAVGINPAKNNSGETGQLSFKEISENILPYHQVVHYSGFLTDFISKLPYKTTVIRGIRDAGDFEFESRQLQFMRELNNNMDVVYIPCDLEYKHISSSAIRLMESIEKGSADKYLINSEIKNPIAESIVKESKIFN